MRKKLHLFSFKFSIKIVNCTQENFPMQGIKLHVNSHELSLHLTICRFISIIRYSIKWFYFFARECFVETDHRIQENRWYLQIQTVSFHPANPLGEAGDTWPYLPL